MIESITLENFLSYKEKTEFEFKGTSEKPKAGYEHIEWYNTTIGKKKLLKAIFLFGNNGAGKSNFMCSFDILRNIITGRRKNKSGDDQELPETFFKLSKATQDQPSSINIKFHYKEVNYIYVIKWDTESILYEDLQKQIGIRKIIPIYTRIHSKEDDVVKIVFPEKSDFSLETQQLLRDTVIRNTSVISIYDERNFISEDFKNVFEYFKRLTRFGDISRLNLCGMLYAKRKSGDLLKIITLQLLQDLGSNISDYKIENISVPLSDIEKNMLKSGMDEEKMNELFPGGNKKVQILKFAHYTNEQAEPFYLNEGEESEGTLNMIRLIIMLFDAIQNQVPIAIDECAVGIHQEVFSHIIQFFLTSSDTAQVFFATQALPILNMKGYRRDTTRFFDKEKETGVSFYKTIDMKKFHKNLNILNSYLDNSFGGVPSFPDEKVWKDKLNDYKKIINYSPINHTEE